jgi:hypothetical protein
MGQFLTDLLKEFVGWTQGKKAPNKFSFVLFCFMSNVWILAIHTVIYLPSRKSITISNNRISQVLMRAMLVVLFD